MKLHLDLETRSPHDISTTGVHAYSDGVEILIACWALDDGPVEVWDITYDEPPHELINLLKNSSVTVCAHNAQFERLVLKSAWGIDVPYHRWDCTATRARQCNIPAPLEQCAAVLKLAHQKDTNGKRLIKKFSVPPYAEPDENDSDWQSFVAYCAQDVRVGRIVDRVLPAMQEPDVWFIEQEINDRGVLIDLELVRALARIDAYHRSELMLDLSALTGLENPNSNVQLREWLAENGCDVPNMQSGTLDALPEQREPVASVLTMKRQLSQTASKKLEPMQVATCRDGRARGLLQYYGAGQTGRWSGRRIQTQNMPRGSQIVTPALIECARRGDLEWLVAMYGNDVQGTIGSLLRACITAPNGYRLVISDYSAIEARVLAWLAGEEWVLEEFRGEGKIYEATAAQMYRVPKDKVTKAQRQNGKGACLGAGFGGGAAAVEAFGVERSIAKKVVDDWRKANPNIVKYWSDVWSAAIKAIRNPGEIIPAGRVSYRADSFGLWCRLPSGRKLAYPGAKISGDNIQTDRKIWHGVLVENMTQAIARDLLADAIVRCERAKLRVIMHVHDEIVLESSHLEADLETLVQIMSTGPAWADGLPLKSVGEITKRYKK